MTTTNYLEKIKNPYDKENFLKKIVEIYSTSEDNFSDRISAIEPKKYKKGNHDPKSSDIFYSKIFNTWKNTIVNLSADEIKNNKKYNDDVLILKEFLKNIKDINTEKEIDKIINNISDIDIESAFQKYKWDNLVKDNKHIHISSSYLNNNNGLQTIEHALYVNCESQTLYELLNEFINECEKYGIPFYFKYNSLCNTDDSIVIYTNSEYLDRHLKILQDSIKNTEQARIYLKKPSLLVGELTENIGYGSETPNDSYFKLRTEIIEESIKKVMYSDIKKHITSTTTYKGKKIQFSQFLSILTTEYFCKKLENKYVEKSKVINEPEMELGYNLSQIKHKALKGNVCELINKSIINNLFLLFDGKKSKIKNIEMSVDNNKKVTFTGTDLENATSIIAKTIFSDNPSLYDELKSEIISSCREKGISSNFAIASNIESALKEIEEIELKELISSEEMLSMETEKLIDRINPEYLNQSIKLENGSSMIMINYLKNVIYPLIPYNGKFILKDNSEIDAITFVEKFLIGECQKLYNGELSRYLFEKTKMNNGKIEINYDGDINTIESMDIVDYLTNDILTKRVTYNGQNITAEEYIISYFSDFIPSNGMFILKDNKEITAIDYICNVLLGEIQEKHQGNIMKILMETTKNNKNTINFT